MRLLGFAMAIVGAAGAAGGPLAAGTWGGEHLRLEVDPKQGVTLDFDCASGSMSKVPVADAQGAFDVEGRYLQERGGPVRKDDDRTGAPVRYRGTVRGEALELTVVLGPEETVGPFSLRHGQPGRVVKCR